MLDETRTQQIENAISAQEGQEQPWTNQSIYDVVGGNYGELAQYLKARRAQTRRPGRGGGAATAVAEAEVEAQEPPTAQEELDAARLAYSHASGRLAQLRSQGASLMLSEAEETEMLRLEARIERMTPVLERLAKAVAEEQEHTDVEAFKTSWDALAAAKVQAYEAFVQSVRQLWQGLFAILEVHRQQEVSIDTLPPRLAQRLHDQFLPDPQTLKKRIAGSMVSAHGWDLVLTAPGDVRLALPADLMANDPGTRPLPARLLPNIMEGRL